MDGQLVEEDEDGSANDVVEMKLEQTNFTGNHARLIKVTMYSRRSAQLWNLTLNNNTASGNVGNVFRGQYMSKHIQMDKRTPLR